MDTTMFRPKYADGGLGSGLSAPRRSVGGGDYDETVVTALYRRYRPESFAELIGQSQVTDPLMTALRTNRVNHAYLFSGPRGCGKTTSARILARCLNCVEGPTDTPCGVCPSCVELSRDGGGSLDVVEIDAASHNGVDDARDLRERAIFAPARDRYKIFILDEAHMVTPQGFNALLKIVEEPPEHIKFIFATTEPDKVIGTIRSRTHHYPFRLIPPAQMLEYVQTLCESEKVQVEPGVLPLVVRAGGGSARDTLSLLDQLMAGSEGDTVDYERAVALLGYTHSALLDEVIDALSARDAGAAFSAVDRVIQTGQDPRRFVDDLLERLRDLIVVGATGGDAASVLRGIPQDELDHMAVQATGFGQAELSRTADIVNTALSEMTGATSPRLHLELMVARVLVPSMDDTARGALARVERLERRVGMSDAATTDAADAAPVASAQRSFDEPVAAVARTAPTAAPARPAEPQAASAAPAPSVTVKPVGPVTLQQLRDSWTEILERVAAVKRSAWLVAQTATVRAFSDDAVLRLSFPSAKDVDDFKHLNAGDGVSTIVRSAIFDVLGVTVKFIAHADAPGDTDATPRGTPPAPTQPPTGGSPGAPGAGGAGGASGVGGPVPGSGPTASAGGGPAASASPVASASPAPTAAAASAPPREAPAHAPAAPGSSVPNSPTTPPAAANTSGAGASVSTGAAASGTPTPANPTAQLSGDASGGPDTAAGTRTPAGVRPLAAASGATPPASRATQTAPAAASQTAPAAATQAAPAAAGGWHVVAIPTTDPTRQPDDAPPLADGPSLADAPPRDDTPFGDAPPFDDAPPPDEEPPYPDPQGDREPVAIGDVPTVIPPGRFTPPAGRTDATGRAPAPAATRRADATAPDPITAARQAVSGAAAANATPRQVAAAPSDQPGPSVTPTVQAGRPMNRQTVHPAASARYGESVVRELLGASFIEEQPHTPPTRFNRD
jgi:DNA polymerase-3 subunit gamma/tau